MAISGVQAAHDYDMEDPEAQLDVDAGYIPVLYSVHDGVVAGSGAPVSGNSPALDPQSLSGDAVHGKPVRFSCFLPPDGDVDTRGAAEDALLEFTSADLHPRKKRRQFYEGVGDSCTGSGEKSAVIESLQTAALDVGGLPTTIDEVAERQSQCYDMVAASTSDYASCQRYLAMLRLVRVRPTRAIYNLMLMRCSSEGKCAEALTLYEDMFSDGLLPMKVTSVNTVLLALCRGKMAAEAMAIYLDLPKVLEPSFATLNAAADPPPPSQQQQQQPAEGNKSELPVDTLITLLRCVLEDCPSSAVSHIGGLVQKIRQMGGMLDQSIFVRYCEILLQHDQSVEAVRAFLSHLCGEGQTPPADVANAVLARVCDGAYTVSARCTAKQASDEAFNIARTCFAANVQLAPQTYTALFKACQRAADLKGAVIYERMIRNPVVSPESKTAYLQLVASLAREKIRKGMRKERHEVVFSLLQDVISLYTASLMHQQESSAATSKVEAAVAGVVSATTTAVECFLEIPPGDLDPVAAGSVRIEVQHAIRSLLLGLDFALRTRCDKAQLATWVPNLINKFFLFVTSAPARSCLADHSQQEVQQLVDSIRRFDACVAAATLSIDMGTAERTATVPCDAKMLSGGVANAYLIALDTASVQQMDTSNGEKAIQTMLTTYNKRGGRGRLVLPFLTAMNVLPQHNAAVTLRNIMSSKGTTDWVCIAGFSSTVAQMFALAKAEKDSGGTVSGGRELVSLVALLHSLRADSIATGHAIRLMSVVGSAAAVEGVAAGTPEPLRPKPVVAFQSLVQKMLPSNGSA